MATNPTLLVAASDERRGEIEPHLATTGYNVTSTTVYRQSVLSVAMRNRNRSHEHVVIDANIGRELCDTLADHFSTVPVIVSTGPEGLSETLDIARRFVTHTDGI